MIRMILSTISLNKSFKNAVLQQTLNFQVDWINRYGDAAAIYEINYRRKKKIKKQLAK